ncbi:hypothetical protein [Streptomyces sp. NPDC101206]|uniref:hypothetical protein n=1 Tax=Streptomyces sp. NPDC101206 TaxID=3366128 RepID=UPI0038262BAB
MCALVPSAYENPPSCSRLAAASDADAEFLTAQGLVAIEVVDSGCFSRREFHESCGQVGHMYWASDLVCEQDAGAVAGGKVVNGTLAFGLPVAGDHEVRATTASGCTCRIPVFAGAFAAPYG